MNVSSVSLNDNIFNTASSCINGHLPNHEPSEGPESGSQNRDTCRVSEMSRLLSRSGLDVERSFVERTGEAIDFQLVYSRSRLESLSANGYFAQEREECHLSLQYVFHQDIVVDGRTERRVFAMELSFTATHVQSLRVSPFEGKEDILQLVQRLILDMMDIIQDDETKLAGVIFDFEDVQDIARIEDGRLLQKLEALIRLVIVHTHILESMDSKKDEEAVVLHPKRIKVVGVKEEKQEVAFSSFHMEIRQLENVSSALSAPDETGDHTQNAYDTLQSPMPETKRVGLNKVSHLNDSRKYA